MDGLVERRYITMVGSRKIKPFFMKLMTIVAKEAVSRGFTVRTGDAIGADDASRRGTKRHQRVIYSAKEKEGAICGPSLPNWEDALAIAEAIHPAWERCSPFAKLLHGRNPYQVLGESLNDPSELFVCCAPPNGKDGVSGGTNTAYQVAKDWGIPIFNIYLKEDYNALKEFLLTLPIIER